METPIKNIAVFIPGRLYRNSTQYDFSFLKTMKDFYNSHYINVYFFASLSTECDIPFITTELINLLEISNEQLNRESVICPSIIYNFPKRPETNYENTYKMFYHNYKCFYLIQQYSKKYNINFDVLIKWRTDIDIIDEQSFLQDSLKHFSTFSDNTNKIYVPGQDLFWGMSDQLAYGNYYCMNKYCTTIANIISLCKLGYVYHPETLLGAQCFTNDIFIDTFNISYKLF